MKTFFWNRILVPSGGSLRSSSSSSSLTFGPEQMSVSTIWSQIKEVEIDTNEFEERFSKNSNSLISSNSSNSSNSRGAGAGGEGVIRVLDPRKSQAIAIMKSSLPNENILR